MPDITKEQDMALINEQAFHLIMSRFDKLEAQNTEQNELMQAHILTDSKIKEVVDQHATYWSAVKWIIGVIVLIILGTLGLK